MDRYGHHYFDGYPTQPSIKVPENISNTELISYNPKMFSEKNSTKKEK